MKLAKKAKYSVVIIISLAFWVYFTIELFLPVKILPSPKENFIVHKNSSQKELVDKLRKDNLIRNKIIFSFFLERKNITIQPGTYLLSGHMSLNQILNVLSRPPFEIWITIPEGLRKEEIAKIFQKKLGWKQSEVKEFIKSSEEGYLFPDTYLFNQKSSPQIVIKRLNNQFQKEYNLLSFGDNINKKEITIIASLVQREAKNKQEMPVISGIIQNRLKASMPLDIDASLQYIRGNAQNWWSPITEKNKKIDSPFNTYKYKGLPPFPICNPGKEALKAALYPAKTNYFYYLHDPLGRIHYAKTYSEHLRNIKRYLKAQI